MLFQTAVVVDTLKRAFNMMREDSLQAISIKDPAARAAKEQETTLWRETHHQDSRVHAERYRALLAVLGLNLAEEQKASYKEVSITEAFSFDKEEVPRVHVRLTSMENAPMESGGMGQVGNADPRYYFEEGFWSRVEIVAVSDKTTVAYYLFHLCQLVIINARLYFTEQGLGALEIMEGSGQVHKHEMALGEKAPLHYGCALFIKLRSDVPFAKIRNTAGKRPAYVFDPQFQDGGLYGRTVPGNANDENNNETDANQNDVNNTPIVN